MVRQVYSCPSSVIIDHTSSTLTRKIQRQNGEDRDDPPRLLTIQRRSSEKTSHKAMILPTSMMNCSGYVYEDAAGERAMLSDPSTSGTMPLEKLLELDRRHVWHPYASMPASYDSVAVESANGVYLNVKVASTTTTDSTIKLVDGMSSWWAAIHGYTQPHLNQAVVSQLDRMSHVMFGGLTHEPAVRLATRLAHCSGLDHVFFADSGSVAIEVALKMAQQYWYNLELPKKNRFLTVRGGYHGDTFHAMSVCDPVNGMHHLFQTVLQKQLFADKPSPAFGSDDDEWDEQHIDSLKRLLENHCDEIAAVILEPIVQGAGGMHFYSPMYLKRVRDLCDEYNALLIADEIATGFGRTGKFFACEHAQIHPDILCLGKAITGGYLSFAATLTSTKVAQVFQRGEAGVLMHGPTFMGNPLACAVANASLDLLETNHWKKQVPAIEQQLKIELAPCLESPLVKDVRVLGAIGVVELKEPVDMRTMQPAIVEEGVWLRPFGKLMYTMPPFIIEPHQLRKITRAMVKLTRRRL